MIDLNMLATLTDEFVARKGDFDAVLLTPVRDLLKDAAPEAGTQFETCRLHEADAFQVSGRFTGTQDVDPITDFPNAGPALAFARALAGTADLAFFNQVLDSKKGVVDSIRIDMLKAYSDVREFVFRSDRSCRLVVKIGLDGDVSATAFEGALDQPGQGAAALYESGDHPIPEPYAGGELTPAEIARLICDDSVLSVRIPDKVFELYGVQRWNESDGDPRLESYTEVYEAMVEVATAYAPSLGVTRSNTGTIRDASVASRTHLMVLAGFLQRHALGGPFDLVEAAVAHELRIEKLSSY